MIKTLYKENHINRALSVFLSVSVGLLNFFTAYLFKSVADIAENGTGRDVVRLLVIAVVYIAIYIFMVMVKRTVVSRYIKRGILQIKNEYMRRLLYQDNMECKEDKSIYTSSLTNDISVIEDDYLLGGIRIITNCVIFVCGVGIMLYLSWIMTLTIALACCIPLLLTSKHGKNIEKAQKFVSDENGRFLAGVGGIFSGFSVIKIFRAEKELLNSFKIMNERLEEGKRNRRNVITESNLISYASSFLVTAGVCCVGTLLAIKGVMTVGMIIAFIQLLDSALNPIQELGPLLSKRKSARILLDKMDNSSSYSERESEDSQVLSRVDEIDIRNATLIIENKTILDKVSISIEHGKSYAIVGHSGSGKSTFLRMLLGYYPQYEGTIKYDGIELNSISLKSVFGIASLIPQDVYIFDDSLINNITMYKEFEPSEIRKAINSVGLQDVITQKGENYQCGVNGAALSGGEKQRIAIARSLLCNPSIIMFDEATSALDNALDFQIQNLILSLNKQIRIVITHRLNEDILKKYDKIIVFNKGMMVEIGDFDELIDRRGFFYALYKIQQ